MLLVIKAMWADGSLSVEAENIMLNASNAIDCGVLYTVQKDAQLQACRGVFTASHIPTHAPQSR
jgi:hypothetical protein